MNELISPVAFKWTMTILTAALAGPWFIYDSLNLIRARTLDRRDLGNRDKQFGYGIGICVGAIGVIGCLLFHDVL